MWDWGLTHALYSMPFGSFCLLPPICVAFMIFHDGLFSLGLSGFIYGTSYRNVEDGLQLAFLYFSVSRNLHILYLSHEAIR